MKNSAKKGLMSLVAVGCLALPFSAAASNDKNQYDGGSEIIYDGNVSIQVDSGEVGGGYWIRGKKDGNVYSSYKHYKKLGRGSVVNGAGDYKDGGWKDPDIFSTAKLDWTFWGVNKAYYNSK